MSMIFVLILAIIPVIIWGFMQPLGLRFFDLATTFTSIGQILGLVGMTLFSVNLILAGRFKFLDKYFKGLDKVYANHSKIGAISFSMLLFHPLFLVVQYLTISIYNAGMFFVPFVSAPITWGIFSLLLMILLMVFTFYVKFKYHVWKFSHKFMTFAFFLGVIHTILISSDVSRNNFLRYYIFTLAFLAIFSIIRKVYFDNNPTNKFKYKVEKVTTLNQDIVEIEMRPLTKNMLFSPGQFAFFRFFTGQVSSESHPFSISSSPSESNLKFTFKNLGDYTSLLKNIKENDGVIVDGPYGNFFYKNVESKNQVWVAGGIGITPFFSMAQSLDSSYNIELYYSVKEEKEAVYVNIFRYLSEMNPNFKFNLWVAKDKGYINSGEISGLSKGLDGKDIFLCGPAGFMESLKNQFLSLGVDIKKIHYENFNF